MKTYHEDEACSSCSLPHEMLAEFRCEGCGATVCDVQARGSDTAQYHHVRLRGETVPCGPLEEM